MRFWPRKPARPPASAPPTKALAYTRLTLDTWRSSPERVSFVADLLRQPLFLELVGMLAAMRPLPTGPLNEATAALALGQRMGHDQLIAALLAAGTPKPAPPDPLPPADYDAANTMALWERESAENAL